MTVTPLIKDNVLNYLCDQLPLEKDKCYLNTNEMMLATQTEIDVLKGILEQFKRLGLISDLGFTSKIARIKLCLEAIDLKNRGGFYAQEELLQLSLEKLLLELDELRSKFPEKTATFTGIMANITTCLSFISGLVAK